MICVQQKARAEEGVEEYLEMFNRLDNDRRGIKGQLNAIQHHMLKYALKLMEDPSAPHIHRLVSQHT
jgi:ABC-type branched-subunit amino acid transport system ATPase component